MFPCSAPYSARKGGFTVRSGAIRGGAAKAASLRGHPKVALLFPRITPPLGQGSTVAPQGNMLLHDTGADKKLWVESMMKSKDKNKKRRMIQTGKA
ncbi:hypothetical protein NDK47_02585 [Brevibacillus ruminantium]|uniref:Uncharacterized protein n=1 Tax=Brevibacillus ruminantium TaxID=2950604 RepID=A0ABY4WJK2_9BACL|nr:hypothetical protein [Brevibacillus ruminantium]USG66242.1 hypothetical protein NDK47_02585 [Brevibacillus ruminantium]